MAVQFIDNSVEVKAEINEKSIAWLYAWSDEIASTAKDNCVMSDDDGQLKKSYRAEVDEKAGKAQIGSSLESAFWEEYGTGEHAVRNPHRSGWWVYIEGGSGYEGPTKHYRSKEEAEAAAKHIYKEYGKKAVATNGRDPNYTLEKAFTKNKPKAIADAERTLKGL
jgi:hypothetical protein